MVCRRAGRASELLPQETLSGGSRTKLAHVPPPGRVCECASTARPVLPHALRVCCVLKVFHGARNPATFAPILFRSLSPCLLIATQTFNADLAFYMGSSLSRRVAYSRVRRAAVPLISPLGRLLVLRLSVNDALFSTNLCTRCCLRFIAFSLVLAFHYGIRV